MPLFGGSERVLRRLRMLWNAGYLYRHPRNDVYEQWLYSLGNKGADLLAEVYGFPRKRVNWTDKNQKFTEFPHALLIAEAMVKIELGARSLPGVEFIHPMEILEKAPVVAKQRFLHVRRDKRFEVKARVKTPSEGYAEASAYPDWMFAIRFEHGGQRLQRCFFLEADRASMPVTTPNFFRPSIYKKMQVYSAAGKRHAGGQSVFSQVFGIPNFRTLFLVSPSKKGSGATRVQSFLRAALQLTEGKGTQQFLFADHTWLGSTNVVIEDLLNGLNTPDTLIPCPESVSAGV